MVKNKIKITGEDSMEIMKSGITNAHMVFEKNQMNVTYYDTPYGQLHVGIHTRKLDVEWMMSELILLWSTGLM